jgi:enamine deaminase RidA (YjgF/YER057c/UK114 family)
LWKEVVVKKEQVNPASWQEKFGYTQGCRVDEAQRLLFVAGQIALDEDGQLVGEGDFEAQTRQVFANMGRVLELAGMSFENVVQVGVFMTDIGQLRTYARVRDEFVNTATPPASTAIGVTSLALPDLLVEVNAIAVS